MLLLREYLLPYIHTYIHTYIHHTMIIIIHTYIHTHIHTYPGEAGERKKRHPTYPQERQTCINKKIQKTHKTQTQTHPYPHKRASLQTSPNVVLMTKSKRLVKVVQQLLQVIRITLQRWRRRLKVWITHVCFPFHVKYILHTYIRIYIHTYIDMIASAKEPDIRHAVL